MFKFNRFISAAALCAAWLSATTTSYAADTDVTIEFDLQAAHQPARCGQVLPPLGVSAQTARLRDARFYVHDVALIDAEGRATPLQLQRTPWQYLNLALLDFEDGSGGAYGCAGGTAATNTRITGRVPPGDYRGLQFRIGVPDTALAEDGQPRPLNHSPTSGTPAPLDQPALAAPWPGGRRHLKVELTPTTGVQRSTGTSAVWVFQLSSTGCQGRIEQRDTATCQTANRPHVLLKSFMAQRQRVVLDLAELFGHSDIGRDHSGASGCISAPGDPECTPLFERLGLGRHEAGETRSAQIFRVEDLPALHHRTFSE